MKNTFNIKPTDDMWSLIPVNSQGHPKMGAKSSTCLQESVSCAFQAADALHDMYLTAFKIEGEFEKQFVMWNDVLLLKGKN